MDSYRGTGDSTLHAIMRPISKVIAIVCERENSQMYKQVFGRLNLMNLIMLLSKKESTTFDGFGNIHSVWYLASQ